MDFYLFYCPECHTIFKCSPNISWDVLTGLQRCKTDFDDYIILCIQLGFWICPKCCTENQEYINCEDWVAEKVFTVKGETSTSRPV